MPFSTIRSAYCPSPSFSSQSAMSCIGFTDAQLAACRTLDYCSRNAMPLFPELPPVVCALRLCGFLLPNAALRNQADKIIAWD